MYNWLPMITSLYSAYLLLSWFSSLRVSLLLLAVITQMTQQWLHRKGFSQLLLWRLSWFSSNPGGCPTCVFSGDRKGRVGKKCMCPGLTERPFQVYKASWGTSVTEILRQPEWDEVLQPVLLRSLQVHSCGLFSPARACWVLQIGVNWLTFIPEEPQGCRVISTEREKLRRDGKPESSSIILKCCQSRIWHCPLIFVLSFTASEMIDSIQKLFPSVHMFTCFSLTAREIHEMSATWKRT